MAESSFKVYGELPNKIVHYKNLYFKRGTFYFVSTRFVDLQGVYLNVHYLETNTSPWKPILDCNQEILAQAHYISGLFYFGSATLVEHPGHTIFDDCIAQFDVLSELGLMAKEFPIYTILQDSPNISSGTDIVHYDVKGIYNLAFGSKAVFLSKVTERYAKDSDDFLCFSDVIVGSGERGLSNYNQEYVSPGLSNQLWSRWKYHLYKRAGLCESFVEEEVTDPSQVTILMVYSKNRPLQNFWEIHEALSKRYVNYTYVDWGEISDISLQLKLCHKTQIYITVDGSCALNCVFLPKNAVMINFGTVINTSKGPVLGWIEDYLYPTLDYIKVLYFSNYYNSFKFIESKLNIPLPDLLDCIGMALTLDMKSNNNNRSPNAIKFLKLTDHKLVWQSMRRNNLAYACSLLLTERS